MSGFPWAASLAVIRRLNPFFLMKKTRRRTACDGTGKGLCLEPRKGFGPWDGVVDPEGGKQRETGSLPVVPIPQAGSLSHGQLA